MKNKIITYISFVAVLISIMTILLSTIFTKTDLKFTSLILGIVASIMGVFLAIFYKKLTTSKYPDKVYISYALADKEMAEFIRSELIRTNFSFNIDEENIKIGENIKETMKMELDSSSVVIVLISNSTIKSTHVASEIDYALKNNKKILPVLLEMNAPMPEGLKEIKYADFTNSKYAELSKLRDAILNNLNERKSVHNTKSNSRKAPKKEPLYR